MTEQHARFLKGLEGSSRAVFLVALMQHRRGRAVEIPPLRFAPSAAEAEGYGDGGDIIVVRRMRVEVKHRGFSFTGPADFKYPEGVFLGNVGLVDADLDNLLAYAIVSEDYRYVAVVHHSTRPYWFTKKVKPEGRANTEDVYVCPLEHVDFQAVTDG